MSARSSDSTPYLEPVPAVTYSCVTGHVIRFDALGQETQLVKLDQGAEVRICRQHGAPIALTVPAGEAAP